MSLPSADDHFRRLIENGNDLLMIAAPDLGVTYVSPSAERLLGYRPDEMVGRQPAELLHPDDVPPLFAVLGEALAEPETVRQLTWRIRHRDGKWRVMEALTRMLTPGDPSAGFLVNARDVTERQGVEEALRQSEERYRVLVESLNEVVFHSDAQGRWTFLNRAWSAVTGMTVEESIGRTFLDFAHPDDLPTCYHSYQLLLSGEHESVRHDVRFRHRDGGWRQIEVFVRAVRNADGEIAGTTGTLNDVTDRKNAEQALRESEEQFRRMIENGNDLLMISAPDLSLTYVSPSVEHLLGYTPEYMIGIRPDDVLHPDDLPAVYTGMREIFETPGVVRRISWRIRHKNGTWRHYEAFGRTLDPNAPERGAVCNGRDVTERLEAQEALRRSEEHFRRLIENGSDLLMVSRADGPLTYVSPSAERLLGYTPSEMLGKVPADLVHPEDEHVVLDGLRRIAAEPGSVHPIALRMRHKDGSWRALEAIGRTVSPDSADEGIVANSRDVTARIEAEAALRQARADAEQAHAEAERANRAKSEFLSRMSHELRTPLNSILGFAQLLDAVDLEPDYRTGVGYILAGGRHLLKLIDEVLDIARIEAGEQAMSLELVRVLDVVREAVDLVRPLAAARDVRVVEAVATQGYVRADRQRLTQVLLNLLSNAVKYNRPGGEVRVDAVSITSPGTASGRVRIRVRDEGAGLTPEQQAGLFVPFARLGAERTDVEGTGLGLALSRGLAEAMGGTLDLETSGPGGSVFSVDLEGAADPLTATPATAMVGIQSWMAADQAASLLYIEDNAANLRLVETVLRNHPAWRVIPASDGVRGLALAAEQQPDIVLLDLHLPDMHGLEVLRRLRAEPRTAKTPVVVVSADATARVAETLVAEGANAFLTKPLDVRLFAQTVERLLRERQAGA